jgi:anti-sigma factor ChrR (cupin superfamily)
MSTPLERNNCPQSETTCAYALRALDGSEADYAAQHIASCPDCRRELAALQPVVRAMPVWPSDPMQPAASLQSRLAERIAKETGGKPVPPPAPQYAEPAWEKVAPGIWCKLLANDTERHRISMLVRLEPKASYPPHTHVGVEELHLLDGELWIEDRLLHPGDYNYGPPGASDQRVYSETGCMCVLITSTKDQLR